MNQFGNNFSRRDFLKVNTLGGIGAALSLRNFLPTDKSSAPKTLDVRPRYHRWHVDPGVEWLEKNTGYAQLDWSIPLSQTALVLVDVWQRHYLKDTEERGEAVIDNQLVPMLASCRQYGMNIIHAPSPGVAKQHPNWVKLIKKEELEIPVGSKVCQSSMPPPPRSLKGI